MKTKTKENNYKITCRRHGQTSTWEYRVISAPDKDTAFFRARHLLEEEKRAHIIDIVSIRKVR